MNRNLLIQALVKLFAGIILVGLMVFLPAGSFGYWQGWLLMGVLFVPMLIVGVVMLVKNQGLLRKRLDAKEKEGEQKRVVALSGVLFIVSFVTAGLNWRYGWWMLPDWVVWVAAAIFILSYILYAEVLRENEYLSRTIEVQKGQKVIDTGLYGIVRHPMYLATVIMFLSMPLVLGSPISFIAMLGYFPVIAKRIRNEEEVLAAGLDGYKEYQMRVKYKVIPFIW
ncbi:MAG: isoprenylcysteine carboxylmethyltransferase family protein [Bacteroidales bacterium]|nr:isoprenylcysteine carboxylmethyltransferase family protein [Bacteroidales bacterium]